MNIFKRIINRGQVTFFPTLQQNELRRWYREDGQSIKRFDYPLNSESIVIDLGGYDGQWTSDLFSRYLNSVYLFEPIPTFAEKIAHRFEANTKIKVYPYGIGDHARTDQMSLNGTGSSLLRRKPQEGTSVRIEDAAKLLHICGISRCDLLKINIEGGEYEVLPRLIETGVISAIDNILIQFHNFETDSLEKMNTIQAELSKTHERTWSYTWVWENWKRKDR
jgi:FkbM family methyltransferase